MTQLIWNAIGDRFFEAGVDRGVLYTVDGSGVPWNGLTSVKDAPSGGDASPFYQDGVKYLNVANREEVVGTIEAFTYPDEFAVHDGTVSLDSGISAMQQPRLPFALSYRTMLGNDIDGIDYGYKIHIIYNILAAPSEKDYGSLNADVDPLTFSWGFTTTPVIPDTDTVLAPLSHVIIDSTKTSPNVLRYIEEQLYGSSRVDSYLIDIDDLFGFFENPEFVLSIFADAVGGMSQLIVETDGTGDLIGDEDLGLYSALSESRLVATATPGLYTLES